MRPPAHRPPPVVVDVWWADLTQADISLARWLPPAERERVMALERPADRGRRLVAAALLQHAVAASRRGDAGAHDVHLLLERAPDRPVDVDRTCAECGARHGRPVVAGGPHLSVAHAGALVVVATCAAAVVGVDVERTARFADGPGERGEAGERGRALAWTRQEAARKAGVAPLPAGPGTHPAEPRVHATFTALRPGLPGYAATLCVATDGALGVTEHHLARR